MKMLRSNFETVVRIALIERKTYERDCYGPEFESSFVAGLEEILDALQKGEPIEIADS